MRVALIGVERARARASRTYGRARRRQVSGRADSEAPFEFLEMGPHRQDKKGLGAPKRDMRPMEHWRGKVMGTELCSRQDLRLDNPIRSSCLWRSLSRAAPSSQ